MASSDAEVITGVRWMCDAMRRCAAWMASRSGPTISRSRAVGVVLIVSRKFLREVRGGCVRMLRDCETLWHSLCHHAAHAYGRLAPHLPRSLPALAGRGNDRRVAGNLSQLSGVERPHRGHAGDGWTLLSWGCHAAYQLSCMPCGLRMLDLRV